MFIKISRLISPVSFLKHTLVYSTQNTENTPKITTRGAVGRYIRINFPFFSLTVGPARESAQSFGEICSGSDGVWRRVHCTLPQTSKIWCFYFLEICMFIKISRLISPVSCLKHTPVYSTQNPENALKINTRGAVGRYIRVIFSVFRLWSDQLGGRLNVLGKSARAQMKFGGGHTAHSHSYPKYGVFISSKSPCLSSYRASYHKYHA